MKNILHTALLLGALAASSAAWAAEKTVTLAVKGMYCASCPYIVRGSMAAVEGVAKVEVSVADQSATVTFDDGKTTIAAIALASTNAGYPATVW
ncbi:MAG: mercury resistance system periplasmic binding protein MerP [Alphaproteobacteria bacterium]